MNIKKYIFSRGNVEAGFVFNPIYTGKSMYVGAQDNNPMGLAIAPDGTKVFSLGSQYRHMRQYNLTTAWDLDTGAYNQTGAMTQGSWMTGMTVSSDGTKAYSCSTQGGGTIYQYTMSTPYTASTLSYDSVSFYVGALESAPEGITFKPDGTRMYMVGSGTDFFYSYTLSTAWDISTATYDSKSFDSNDGAPRDCAIWNDGTRIFYCNDLTGKVREVVLATPWELDTAFYGSAVELTEDVGLRAMCFNVDQTKMFVSGTVSDTVYEYDL